MEKINKDNMQNIKEKVFDEFQQKELELGEITDMLWLVYEDYYGVKENDLYTRANNYDRLERYLINIHTLLCLRKQEMTDFIDEVYAERKGKNNIR